MEARLEGMAGAQLGPQLALAPTVLEWMIAAPVDVSVSVLLAQQIIVGKLPGMGFKVLAQDPGCHVTNYPMLRSVPTCFPCYSHPTLKVVLDLPFLHCNSSLQLTDIKGSYTP